MVLWSTIKNMLRTCNCVVLEGTWGPDGEFHKDFWMGIMI